MLLISYQLSIAQEEQVATINIEDLCPPSNIYGS